MLKWNISRRDQCLCVGVKRTIKQNTPISFLLLHCLLLIPLHLYRQTAMGNLFHVRSRMRRVFPDNRMAWPSCFGQGLSGVLQTGWADESEAEGKKCQKKKKHPDELWIGMDCALFGCYTVVPHTMTCPQCALWRMRHRPSFISISSCSKCFRMMKRCSKNLLRTITCIHKMFGGTCYALIYSQSEFFFFFSYGSGLETLHDSDRSIWMAEFAWKLPHKYNPKALSPSPNPEIPLKSDCASENCSHHLPPACLYMLLLALWCCRPSSVYRDHYVSTKADERETHRDHKRRQASTSDPLIIADSFINMAFLRAAQACAGHGKERGWQTGIHTGHTHEYPNQIPQRGEDGFTVDLGTK